MEGSPSICASQILYEHPQRTAGRQQPCHASNDVVFLFPAPYCTLQQESPLHSLPVPRGCNCPAASCKGNCSPPNLPAWSVRALLQLRLLGDAICHVNSSTRLSHLLSHPPRSTFACFASRMMNPNLLSSCWRARQDDPLPHYRLQNTINKF